MGDVQTAQAEESGIHCWTTLTQALQASVVASLRTLEKGQQRVDNMRGTGSKVPIPPLNGPNP